MRFILTLVASIALVACGGSGSDDNANSNGNGNPNTPTNPSNPGNPGNPSNPSNPNPQASINSANYVQVGQAALSANLYLLDATSVFTGVETHDPAVLVKFTQDRVNKLARRVAAPAQAIGAIEIDEESCDGGNGKIVEEYNDANNNGIDDRGDSFTITVQNCAFAGAILNGQIKMTLDKTTGNLESYPYTVASTVVYNNLSVAMAGFTTTGSGTMTLNINAKNEDMNDINLFASSFSTTTVAAGVTSSQTMKNYSVSLAMRESGRDIVSTSSINGTLQDSNFPSQWLQIKTTQPFVRLSNQRYADQGEIIITDNTKAKVRAKVVNETTVTIDLDADGNGAYETSVNKLWSELL